MINLATEYNPYVVTEEQSRKFPWKMILIVLLILILVGGVSYYLIKKPITVPQITKEMTINPVFASFVDAQFNFAAQPSAEYVQGEGINLYIEVRDFTIKNLSVDVTEDLEIKDSKGATIFTKKNFGLLKQKYTTKIDIVKFSNVVPTIGWTAGKYSAKIIITDNLAKKSITKTMAFSIKEKSKEIIENVIDLKGIVSSNLSETRLVKQQTVWDPNGVVIPELTFNQTVTANLIVLNLSNIDASFKIPERFDAGVYTIEIKYTNLDNGQTSVIKDTITVTKQLAIDQLIFVKSIDENYNYEIQPNSIYPLNTEVFVYLKLIDYAQPETNGKFMVNFTEDVAVLDENGNIAISQKDYIKVSDLNDNKKDGYDIKNSFTTGGLKSGRYTFRAIMKDINSGQQATKEESFTLE